MSEWNWQSNSPTRVSSCLIVGEREHSADVLLSAGISKLSSKPTSYPGLFRAPRRLGHELYKRGSWRLPIVSSKSHSWIPPSLFCQGRGVPYLSWGVRRRLAGERAMTRVLDDLLIFACATGLVTGIVLAAARLLI